MRRPSILFLPSGRQVPIENEVSVLDVALKNKIDLSHSCGGMGSCTTCRIFVQSDVSLLSARTEIESEVAETRGFAANERLACQLEPHDGLEVLIPPPKR
jgi:ferredoxin, 2Fe-2S